MHIHKWTNWSERGWAESRFGGGWDIQYRWCEKCFKMKRRKI